MLTILFDNGTKKEWHVGEIRPFSQCDILRIISLQVDGDELNYITNRCPFHMPNTSVVNLVGVFAQQALANLSNKG